MTEEMSVTERLMTTLISKMESMDHDLQSLKHENAVLAKPFVTPHPCFARLVSYLP